MAGTRGGPGFLEMGSIYVAFKGVFFQYKSMGAVDPRDVVWNPEG